MWNERLVCASVVPDVERGEGSMNHGHDMFKWVQAIFVEHYCIQVEAHHR